VVRARARGGVTTLSPGRLTLCCADLDARPLFWTDPDGRRHGYEPAAAALVAGRLGLEVAWVFRRWADFVPSLHRGECDAVWCGQAITPARREQVAFTRPYARFDESVLVRRFDDVRRPGDLDGRRVGAIAGSTNMALAETFPGVETRAFDGTSDDVLAEMVTALRDGEIDAVVDDEPAFLGLGPETGVRIAFTVPTANAWGAALRHGDDDLREALDGVLDDVVRSGRLRDIWERTLPLLDWPLD
jgi:polar amino acid transport system substrate-binding protein